MPLGATAAILRLPAAPIKRCRHENAAISAASDPAEI
jgi:hypothetical protein